MVDMQIEDYVEEGCDPLLAQAVRRFEDHWNGRRIRYSTFSDRYSLFKLVEIVVLPAWNNYVKCLPPPLRGLCKVLNPKTCDFTVAAKTAMRIPRLARDPKFPIVLSFDSTLGTMRSLLERCEFKQILDDKARHLSWCHSTDSPVTCTRTDVSGNRCDKLTEYGSYLRGMPLADITEKNIQSLNTELCTRHSHGLEPIQGLKRYKHSDNRGALGSGGLGRWGGDGLCRFCGRLTESDALLDAYITGIGPAKTASGGTGDSIIRPSLHYCFAHRPSYEGEQNPDYRKALRHGKKYHDLRGRLQKLSRAKVFPEELLEDHICGNKPLTALDKKQLVRLFEHSLVRKIEAFSTQNVDSSIPDIDEASIGRVAEIVVNAKMTDRKKQIVYLLSMNMNQSQISDKLGITRQAVSKTLKKIPPAFRPAARFV